MSDTVNTLLRDLLAWVAQEARPYDEVIEAWRTSCPRLPVWEDATERGLVEQVRVGSCAMVRVTPAGHAFLSSFKSSAPPEPATKKQMGNSNR